MRFLVGFVLLGWIASLGEAQLDAIIKHASPETAAFVVKDDGSVLVEYDIRYTAGQWAEIQAMKHLDGPSRSKRKAIFGDYYRWSNNEIPYEFAPGEFNAEEQKVVTDAMRLWEKYVCLKFYPRRSDQKNYVYITNQGGCSSWVGMIGGAQWLTLGGGCVLQSVVLHELGHAIGFEHEQCRSDRDDYLIIQLDNVYPNQRYNFDLKDTDNRQIAYDYSSIMQYGEYAFTSNGKQTIITKDPAWQHKIGYSYMLSYADVKLANSIYKCGQRCSPCTGYDDSYMDKDCNCRCPGTPAKICGTEGGDDGLEGCEDFDDYCENWASMGECDNNPGFMLVTCPKACGCGKGRDGSGEIECKDLNSQCNYWAKTGECSRNPGYMDVNCAKACGKCSDDAGDGGSDCVDLDDGCEDWASYGECDNNPGYMHDYCAKSCGTC